MTMNEKNLESTVLLSFKGAEPPPSSGEIERRVREFARVLGVSDAAVEEIVRRIEASLVTTMEEGVSLVNPGEKHNEKWAEEKKISWSYWADYELYLQSEGWGPLVVNKIGDVTDRILGLLNDPDAPGEWDRRGLVIGHVQSGKTANYTGLIAKAADAGYRFIIVIAGIHNNLRKQTQARIDEGFVGRTGESRALTGVGELNRARAFPVPLTNTSSDFSTKFAAANSADLKIYESAGRPAIMVIKKNVKTLENVYTWLRNLNADQAGQISRIPMLLIDDEADNASINTNRADLDPTRTNGEIRKLLKLFRKSCYVGYTATPFANIFINPEDASEMQGDDLFPRNFIYCLDSPSNYFGAQKVFIDEEYSSSVLRTINDAEDLIPLRHKRFDEIIDLPASAWKAVRTFVLAKAVRCARKQSSKHSSMMVNVSRFVDIQRQVKEHTAHFLGQLKDAVRYNYAKPVHEALRNPHMLALKDVFDQEFSACPEQWSEVQLNLFEATKEMRAYLINSRSDEALDYGQYDDAGEALTAVAVGGLSLSRGLTLEGLIVSYMYRNTKMYDTLMQMGRWFGYRQGYEDLCRIYLSEESQGWYGHIAEATEELRQQIKQMRRDGFSPIDFGLYVRAHPDTLIVTALNKMRNAQTRTFQVNYGGSLKETHVLPASQDKRIHNLEEMRKFYRLLSTKGYRNPASGDGSSIWMDVPVNLVIDFVSEFLFHRELRSLKDSFLKYAEEVSDRNPLWDVAFISLVRGKGSPDEVLPMVTQARQVGRDHNQATGKYDGVKKPTEEAGWYVGNKMRVSGKGVEKVGLTEPQMAEAEENGLKNGRSSPTDVDFRTARKKPLLMLHLLDLYHEQPANILCSIVPALGFSFPFSGDTRSVDYVVNRVWLQNDMVDFPEDEDDYDAQ